MACAATSLCPKKARNKSCPLIVGTEIQTIINGRINRTKNTEVKMPMIRNLLRHKMLIVLKDAGVNNGVVYAVDNFEDD